MISPRTNYMETMAQAKRTCVYFDDIVVIVATYAVGIPLNDKTWHPYETYVMFYHGKDFDCGTVHSKTPKEAEKYHDAVVNMLRRCKDAT